MHEVEGRESLIKRLGKRSTDTRSKSCQTFFIVKRIFFSNFAIKLGHFIVQSFLVIRGRYVSSFWTANLEFAEKKIIFDWKIFIFGHFSNVNKQIRS